MNFDKGPITDCIGTFIADFTKQYTKGFAVTLVKDSLDGEKKVTPPDRKLRKFEASAPILQSEVQFSSDGGMKTKPAFWKINSKYNIDVYEKAKDLEASKNPKNTICPWDYSVWYWYPSPEFPGRRGGPPWESGAEKPECPDCKESFSIVNRRKHCRTCGFVKCWSCTEKEWPLYTLGYTEPQGVCKGCYKKLEEEGLDAFKFPEEEEKSEIFGIRMYHDHRKPLYFTVATAELQRAWMDALYSCCRFAEAPRNPSKFQAAAFEAAHRYVWWNQGPWWRWWKVFGSEEEMLTELLSYVVNRQCLGTVLAGIKVPGAARAKAEKVVEGIVEKMVDAAVTASWPKAVEAIGEAEDVLVPKIKAQLDPIGVAKREVVATLQKKISTPISQAIQTVGNPLLEKVLPLMFKPLVKSFVAAQLVLRETYKEFRESLSDDTTAEDWKEKCDSFHFWWRVRDKVTEPELEPMVEAMTLLGKVPPFNYLNASRIKSSIALAVEGILQNAFYTIATEPDVLDQLDAETDAKEVADSAWPLMYEKFCYDSRQIVQETSRSILMEMLAQPILKTVMQAPGVSDALNAAQGVIPKPLQEFFSIPALMEEIIGGALRTIVNKIVEDNMRTGLGALVQVPSMDGRMRKDKSKSRNDDVKLRSDFRSCAILKDRVKGLTIHKQGFVGAETVDRLVEKKIVPNREEAVLLGQQLLRAGFFDNAEKSSAGFKDDDSIYLFKPEGEEGGSSSESEAEPAAIRVGELIPEGNTAVRKVPLVMHGSQPFSIGRSACDFVIDDPRVSSTHVEITYDFSSGKLLIKDTSSNGTFLNGSKIEPGRGVALKAGDKLAFVQGDNPIKFTFQAAKDASDKRNQSKTAGKSSRKLSQSASRNNSPSRNSLSPPRRNSRPASRSRSRSPGAAEGSRRSASVSKRNDKDKDRTKAKTEVNKSSKDEKIDKPRKEKDERSEKRERRESVSRKDKDDRRDRDKDKDSKTKDENGDREKMKEDKGKMKEERRDKEKMKEEDDDNRKSSPSRDRDRKQEREMRKSKAEEGTKTKKVIKKKKRDSATMGMTPDGVMVSIVGESALVKLGQGSGDESSLSEIEARDGNDTDPETEVSAALLLVGRFRKIVDVRDRAEFFGVVKHLQSFVGKEAVTAMVANGLAADRMHAARVANYMLQAGIFEQSNRKESDDTIFKDDNVYYQFTKLQAARKLGILEPTRDTMDANGSAVHVDVLSLEGQPFSFGRLNLEDDRISTKHFEIILDRKEMFVRDTSKNGTQLNGKKLEPGVQTPLLDGAKISVAIKDIGPALTFTFRAANAVEDVFLNSDSAKPEMMPMPPMAGIPVMPMKKKYTRSELVKLHATFQEIAQVKDRTIFFVSYKQTFVGQEVVRDLVQKGIAADRPTAVDLGSELLRAGLIVAAKDDKATRFMDDSTLYRFTNIADSDIQVEAPDPMMEEEKKPKKEKRREKEKVSSESSTMPEEIKRDVGGEMKAERGGGAGEMRGETMKSETKTEKKMETKIEMKSGEAPKMAMKKSASGIGGAEGKKKKKGAKNRRNLADDDKPQNRSVAVGGGGSSFTTPSGVVCTLAGDPEGGLRDGTVNDCAFYHPGGIAVDGMGNIFLSDSGNDRIRKIDTQGNVCTLAGAPRGRTMNNADILVFANPRGIAVDECGNVFVADTDHHRIRRICAEGEISDVAGTGEKGYMDGKCETAMFAYPWGIAIDSDGSLLVSDSGNNRIRRISPSGLVTTVAGCSEAGCIDGVGVTAVFNNPGGLAVDNTGSIIVADRGNNRIRQIAKLGAAVTTLAGGGEQGWRDGYRSEALFNNPDDVAVDSQNNVYVADYQNDRIRRISPQGLVSTIAGSDVRGGANGMGDQASFHSPVALAITPCGKIMVADSLSNQIRCVRILRPVSILAGSGQKAFADGVGDMACFYGPAGVALDPSGNILVADSWNHRIRKICPLSGTVTTAAGSGERATTDGACGEAGFCDPAGVVVDSKGNVIISDSSNNRIRQLAPCGTVTTLAGGEPGYKDGMGREAMFQNQGGLALHPNGNIIIADSGNHRVRQLTPAGEVTTLAGGERGYLDGVGTMAQFDTPDDVAVDANGNIYVGDCNNFRVRVISPQGIVSTLAGSGLEGNADGLGDEASFGYPGGVAVDLQGNVLVADSSNDRICSITPSGEVTTIAGRWEDWQDGIGIEASFRHPVGMAVDADGNILVADYRGHIVYRIHGETAAQAKAQKAEFDKCLTKFQAEPSLAIRRSTHTQQALRTFQDNTIVRQAKRLRVIRSRVREFVESVPLQQSVNREALLARPEPALMAKVTMVTDAFIQAMETVQAFTDATAEVENVESRLATEFDDTLSETLVQRNQLLKQVAELREAIVQEPAARLAKVKGPKDQMLALLRESQTPEMADNSEGNLVEEFKLLTSRSALLEELEANQAKFVRALALENERSLQALSMLGSSDQPEDFTAQWTEATCARHSLTRGLLEAVERSEREMDGAAVVIKRHMYTLQTDIEREGRAFVEPSEEQKVLEAEVRKSAKGLLFFQQFSSALEAVEGVRKRYQQLSNRLFELEEEADNIAKRIQKRRQFAKLGDLRAVRDEVTALRLSRDYRQTTAQLWAFTRFLPELSVEFPELSPFHGTAAQYLEFNSLEDYRDLEELQTGEQHLMFLAKVRSFDDDVKQPDRKFVLKQFEFIKDNSSGVARGVLRRKADLLARMQFDHMVPIQAVVRQEVPEDHDAENWFVQIPYYSRNLTQWSAARRDNLMHEGTWRSVVARVLSGLAAGLGELHASGLFHRNLKPSNVLMDDTDEPLLADFDLRQSLNPEENRGRSDLSLGSVGFVDPEVAFHGAQYSAASDMYALGVIMSEVLLGKRLTSPEDVDNVMRDASKLDADQADLLRKLLAPLGKDRPCASRFMSHKCIQGAKRKICILCHQSVLEIEGGLCEGPRHFVCNLCFSDLVTRQAMESKRQVERRKGRVVCPQKGCSSRPYSSAYVVLHANSNALEAHVQSYETLLNEEPEVADKAVLAELKSLMAMNSRDRRIAAAAKHIKDNILALRCPVCNALHSNFEGSYVLSCERCPTDFCGFCSAVKGSDIYSHVAACPRSLHPGRVFGSKEIFERAQTVQKQQKLERYIVREVPQEDVPFINSQIATELTLLNQASPVVTIRLRE